MTTMTTAVPSVLLHETHDAWPQGGTATNAGSLPSSADRPTITCGRALVLFFSALALCAFAAGPCLFTAGSR
jgi:hypothetical protein